MPGISNVTLYTPRAAGTETDAPLRDPAMHHTEKHTAALLNFGPHLSTATEPRSRKVGQLAPANEGHHRPPSSVRNLSSLRSFVPPFNRIDLALLYRLHYLFSVPQSPIL